MSLPNSPSDPVSIALTFALPDESRAFAAALRDRSVLAGTGHLPVITGRWGSQRVTIVHTGVGESPPYRKRLHELLSGRDHHLEKPRLLISSGYAGGLQSGTEVGDLIFGTNVSHPDLLRKAAVLLSARPVRTGVLSTQPSIAETVAGKRALGAATGAVAVDMETAWIADVCAETATPMLSLRVISDAVEQPFPVPGNILFDARRQRPRYLALPAWLLVHPGSVVPFIRFVRGLDRARVHLAEALQTLVAGL